MSIYARTYKAEATATAKNHFVKTGTAEQGCLLNDTEGGVVIGISDDDLVSGEGAAIVDADGEETLLEMAEACDEGAEIVSNSAAEGKVIDTNATPVNQYVGAVALEAASGDGSVINVVKKGYWKYA